ncbi:choline ABC transporter substrate-binding protein [Vibrio cyclitrophicus]|uniref:choline ABC transporter substrate-binding protein n=1 Tax=Vibrio cyclitrophicus TaxID=47951 RepID=UPI000C820F63|nr:choline ABC transporter substrate-binding protein [Vibrio cyclitrophicus]MCC4772496.1 choline ABC transporter substrate-binding protein [Vibrio cyclitrophicus]MCC4843143.1 choline ABC transporter substrate-binding protein [Vibrio cyclitrophicus]PME10308.1 glycine/betaine ABC transporter substrate-binding protein [Vibrio cyclitrophicus]PME48735.1 glycine/betaine ABC transporter substrate-binding protein [Vibrio cyclitrophicus]PME84673.1 glycine/betaine ABC transporter substrate-binding prote
MTTQHKQTATKTALVTLAISSFAFSAYANASVEPQQCENVRFADVGWTDITATTAVTSELLKGLGYKTKTDLLSVPVTYSSMANGDIDVFLGNWMPTMEGDIAKYREAGTVETVRANLEGAKYTLAVPKYVYDAGVKSFADLAKHAEKFKDRIYGIEPGNDGNRLIQSMIDSDAFGLKDFSLVESSEAGMVSQVSRAARRSQWIVYLGWAPHPMNSNVEMEYLAGGDDFFGPNYGGANVYTNVRSNYLSECSNVGQLLQNLEFTLEMENQLMEEILNQKAKPEQAAQQWLINNPQQVEAWLDNVKTHKGESATQAVTEYLKQVKA